MRSPSLRTEAESYEQSGSSGGGQSSAKDLYQQRKKYGRSVATMGEISEYRVEHLMTLTMERKEAVLSVEDTIRKLQLLDARSKIWIQEVILKVDNKSITLIDCETMEALEVFQLSHIIHVQSVVSAGRYSSICALVVKEHSHLPPDVYLFQCSSVPAEVICADISSAMLDIKNKKGPEKRPETLRRYKDTIEAANQLPSSSPINVKHKVAEWSIKAQAEVPPMTGRNSLVVQNENSPEMIVFKIHRDVDMLNHALDDIEVFVSLLQKSAAASQQLTLRHSKKRNQANGRHRGTGIMEVRARLPPKDRFIDAFQKFRFSFNLLSKLKDQIKDPNAVELVHFLFEPLAMIIHTCCGFELPRTVQTPLLHRETITFLRNCTTTQEMELLERLGDFWIKSRADFPKNMYFPPYVPRFMSGWVPPPIPMMEVETRGLAAAVQKQATQMHQKEEAWRANGANIEEVLESVSPRSVPVVTQIPAREPARKVTRKKSLHSRKVCRAMNDYAARNDDELSVERDELLEVIDDSDEWWRVKSRNGEVGYVPKNVLLLISAASKSSEPSPRYNPPPPIPTPPPVPPVLPAVSAVKVIPTPVPPPPAPPTPPSPVIPPAPKVNPVPTYAVVKKKPSIKAAPTRPLLPSRSAVPVSPTLQQELSHRVGGQNKRNFVLPKKNSSSTAYVIDRSSTSQEVFDWLHSLGFSDSTVSCMGVLSGAQVFAMTRDEIKEICGDEGSRVYSQLMIQRSMDGYSTTNEKSELKKVLDKIRETIPEEEKEP